MKEVKATGLTQAYSGSGWAYSTIDAAYAGFAGGSVYGVAVIRFEVPDFPGASSELLAELLCNIGRGADATLRWAVCSGDSNREMYLATTAEVADPLQLSSGTVIFSGMSDAVEKKTVTLTAKGIKGGETYYLFLWAYNDTGITIKPADSEWGQHGITVRYQSGRVIVKTVSGTEERYIYDGAGNRRIPYIMTNDGPVPLS